MEESEEGKKSNQSGPLAAKPSFTANSGKSLFLSRFLFSLLGKGELALESPWALLAWEPFDLSLTEEMGPGREELEKASEFTVQTELRRAGDVWVPQDSHS